MGSEQTVVVTGAAGGIGRHVARTLAQTGARVAAVDRDAPRLHQEVASLAAEGLAVKALPADVTFAPDAAFVIEETHKQLGPVEALVNVAGVLRLGEVSEFEDEDWDTTFAVNTTGVFRMSRAAVQHMIPHQRGSIVTIASNAARIPRAGMAAYAASKAAAQMFTKSLGLEVAHHGIRCNIVAPGSTDTTMLTGMWPSHDSASGRQRTLEGDLRTYKTGIPLQKVATPQDIAGAVDYLLSEQASHITMETLTVDGGATLGV